MADDSAGQKAGLRFADVIDALPFYVLLVDEEHTIVAANRAVETDLHVDLQEILGAYCPQVVHGLNGPFPGCPLEEAVRVGAPVERDFFDPESGSWLRSAVYPLDVRTASGKRLYYHTTHDITHEKQLAEETRRRANLLGLTNDLLRLSLGEGGLEPFLDQAAQRIAGADWLAAGAATRVFLFDRGAQVLRPVVDTQPDSSGRAMCQRVPLGHCLCGRAAARKGIVHADRIDGDHDSLPIRSADHGHYCVPILRDESLLGVLSVELPVGHRREGWEEEALRAVAGVLATGIERKRTAALLQDTLDGAVRGLVVATELRDPHISGHEDRVARLAAAIARELDLPKETVRRLHIASLLHDVGKIQVPAEILARPGPLSDVEREVMKTHVKAGYDLLTAAGFPAPVPEIVYQHHERLDGSGYPRGLSGDAILLEARIIGVADVVEAMVSHRPYRAARGIAAALAELSAGEGTAYDARVISACRRLFTEKGFTFPALAEPRWAGSPPAGQQFA